MSDSISVRVVNALKAAIAKGLKTSDIKFFNSERNKKGETVNSPITQLKELDVDARVTAYARNASPIAVQTAREIAEMIAASRDYTITESVKGSLTWFNSVDDTTAKLLQ